MLFSKLRSATITNAISSQEAHPGASSQLSLSVLKLFQETELLPNRTLIQKIETDVKTISSLTQQLLATASISDAFPSEQTFKANAIDTISSVATFLQTSQAFAVGERALGELWEDFTHVFEAISKFSSDKHAGGNQLAREFADIATKINDSNGLIAADLASCWSSQLSQLLSTAQTTASYLEPLSISYQALLASSTQLLDAHTEGALLLGAKNVATELANFQELCSHTAKSSKEWLTQEGILSLGKEIGMEVSRLVIVAQHSFKDPDSKHQMQKAHTKLAGYGPSIAPIQFQLQNDLQNEHDFKLLLQALTKAANTKYELPKKTKHPQFSEATKQVIEASMLFFAASTPEQIKRAAAQTLKALPSFLQTTEALPLLCKSPEKVDQFRSSVKAVTQALKNMWEASLATQPTLGNQKDELSGQIEGSLTVLISCAQGMIPPKKVTKTKAKEATADLDNIEAFAEKELLRCAQMIKEAAALLTKLPQKKPSAKMGLDIEQSDIREAILESARAIAAAIGSLIAAATISQGERKTESLTGSTKYNADPAWANGLVSAAHGVAEKVQTLVHAANATVDGTGDEESLIAAANAVNQVTIHLLHASRTKADPNSQAQRNLSKAAHAVSLATGQLVASAKTSSAMAEQDELEDFSNVTSFSIRAQIEQKAKIERLEKELRDTRQELLMLRRAKYQNK